MQKQQRNRRADDPSDDEHSIRRRTGKRETVTEIEIRAGEGTSSHSGLRGRTSRLAYFRGPTRPFPAWLALERLTHRPSFKACSTP